MAWTKAKTALVVGVVALVATSSTVVGYKYLEARSIGGLSPTSMDQVYTVEPEGSVLLETKVSETNQTSWTIRGEEWGDVGPNDQITDSAGRPMKYKKIAGQRGYIVSLNKPVPPGHEVAYVLKGPLGKVCRRNRSGEWALNITQQQGNTQNMHLVEIWRLPAGATLVSNCPEFTPSTNDAGQIELRVDKILPPDGRTPLQFRYRLSGE